MRVSSFAWRGATSLASPSTFANRYGMPGFGRVIRTHFYNTVVMRTPEIGAFLEALREWMDKFPETAEAITRVAQASDRFNFESPQECETKTREILLSFLKLD